MQGQQVLRQRGHQEFGFNALGGMFIAIDAAGQTGGLLREGKTDGSGRDIEGNQTTAFGSSTVDFIGLRDILLRPRGKNRVTVLCRVVARFDEPLFGCP
jgi:hypothetical protein